MPNHLGAEPQLDKQYQAHKQDQWNANGILREVSAFKTVLASLQVDVTCIQETKLLKSINIGQFVTTAHFTGRRPHHPCMAFCAINSTAGTSNVQEKLSVEISLPGQQKILVNNGYLLPETSNFLQRVGFSDLECQTELQQC